MFAPGQRRHTKPTGRRLRYGRIFLDQAEGEVVDLSIVSMLLAVSGAETKGALAVAEMGLLPADTITKSEMRAEIANRYDSLPV